MYQYQLPTSSDKPGTTPAPEKPGDAPADKLSEPGTPGEATPAPGKPGEGSTTKPERPKYKTTIGHDDNEFYF